MAGFPLVVDLAIALGNLVDLVRAQAANFKPCASASPRSSGREGSAALLGVAVDTVEGPRQGLQALWGDGLAAGLAQPESADLDPLQGGLDLDQVLLLAPSQLLATLALGDLRGGGGLGAVRDAGMLDLFRELESKALALGLQRSACAVDDLGIHG